MKKLQLVFAALLLAATTTAAAAQDAAPQRQGGPGRGNQMAALLQGITLTPEQQAKVDSLTKQAQADRQTVMQDQNLDQDARRAKMREMMGKQSEVVKALLTEEQKKVFEKNVADMQARQQGGGRPPRS